MAVTIRLPGALQDLADGRPSLRLEGQHRTVAEALEALRARHPALHARVVTERGEVRPHVNLFVDEREIRRTGGLATPLEGESEIFVLPAVSGG